ncbi:large-conductance mechanosensitive channel protein MscL [Synechococcus sp. Nb3U1]|uniref:large-conductance mechanosensitive channel protein MscL n=1 Tax=Synechococcus sp. Nb3U1 TaxID=1914529 RepID=UPI001F448BE1|nr:large-conductance mechanosensitive channel protein MscL [Synechococcus sp. Nb3U1]MCF2972463.1 large-conductance mechanosensitive channel protein MscL [Synechococcus sp. Nb3U1]
MRAFLEEFKKFIDRGNVLDLAIGVVIGGAFGTIVSSFVADLFTPILGLVIGGVNFQDLVWRIGGTPEEPVTINYGNFLQAVFDFVIIAFAIFLLVRAINTMQEKREEAPAIPPPPSPEVVLLTEIRDILSRGSR